MIHLLHLEFRHYIYTEQDDGYDPDKFDHSQDVLQEVYVYPVLNVIPNLPPEYAINGNNVEKQPDKHGKYHFQTENDKIHGKDILGVKV